MWKVNKRDNSLSMAEGDFGISLPIIISGVTLGSGDSVKVSIKDYPGSPAIVEKTYNNISDNTVPLGLSQADSERLSVGTYYYSLDWYQNGIFMCCIICSAKFEVLAK